MSYLSTDYDAPQDLQIEDLPAPGAVLSEEEIRSISGGLMIASWRCGSAHLTDEWNIR